MSAATDSAQSIRAMRKKEIRNRIVDDLVHQRENAAVSEKCMRKAEKDLEKLKKEGEKVNDYFDYYHKRQLWMAKKRDATDRIAGHKASLASAMEKVKKLEAKLKDLEHQEEQASEPASISAPPVKTTLSSATMGRTSTAVQQPSGSTTTTPAPEERKKPMKVRKLAPELRDLAKRYEAYRASNGAAASQGLGVVTRRKYRAQIEVVLEAYKAGGVTVWLRHDLDDNELPDPEDIKQAAAVAQGKGYRRRKPEVEQAGKESYEELHEPREKPGRSSKKRRVSQDVVKEAATTSKKREVQAPGEEKEEDSAVTESVAPGSPKRKRDEIASAQSVNGVTPAGAADNDDEDEDDQPPTKRCRRVRPQQVSTFQTLMGETNIATATASSTLAKKRKVDSDEADSKHADKRAKIDPPAADSAPAPNDSKSPESTTTTAEEEEDQKHAQEAKRKAIFSIKPAYYHPKQRTSDSFSSSDSSKASRSLVSASSRPATSDNSQGPRLQRAKASIIITKTLHISPLPPHATPASIRDFLASFGFRRDVIEGVSVKGSASSSAAAGATFAFVRFLRADEARAAVRRMDGVSVGRRGRLRVEMAREEMRR